MAAKKKIDKDAAALKIRIQYYRSTIACSTNQKEVVRSDARGGG